LSKDPLIFGKYLKEGQHIDLVGSYKPDMREADDEVIQKSEIFVDILAGATKETGDIVIPIQKGILQKEEIKGDLFSLCRQERSGRSNKKEITLFKSVGHALEDLAAAILAIN
jgi:ornithine cyclodeaminase